MAWFGRRKDSGEDQDMPAPAETGQDRDQALHQGAGPKDSGDAGPPPGYVDLGSLFVPPVPGMQVRAQFEADGKTLHRIQLVLGTSGIRVSVAAAPRSGGVWTELREQFSESVRQQGGSVEEAEGRYGTELQVRLPVQLPNGSQGFSPMRFIGIEGPRWIVRLDIQGAAAAGDAEQIEACDKVIDQLIVNRGSEPRVRLSLLPMQLPKDAAKLGESG